MDGTTRSAEGIPRAHDIHFGTFHSGFRQEIYIHQVTSDFRGGENFGCGYDVCYVCYVCLIPRMSDKKLVLILIVPFLFFP